MNQMWFKADEQSIASHFRLFNTVSELVERLTRRKINVERDIFKFN